MSIKSQEARRYPYFVETRERIEPTLEQFDKGKRLAEAIAQLNDLLFVVGPEDTRIKGRNLNVYWGTCRDQKIVINPSFEVARAIRPGGFGGPLEESLSAEQIIACRFELVSAEDGDASLKFPVLKTGSSNYYVTTPNLRYPRYSETVDEYVHEVAVFNPTEHQIAVID